MASVRADPLDILRLRTSEKWTSYPPDVLPLFVAEMDYPLAPEVSRAIIERVQASDTGYVGRAGALAPAFADFAERTWQWRVDPEQVTTTTDVSVAIVEVLRVLIAPGDGVVITPPVYPPFFDLVPEAGGVVVEVPLIDVNAGYSLDLDGIERAFAAGARAMLLCNPHNPLGLMHSRETLLALSALADRYGAVVVSDEIHGPLAHDPAGFTPYLSVSVSAAEHGVGVTSASKAFNLAGVKCAIIVTAGERMRALTATMPEEVAFRTSILGLHASTAAFVHGGEWLAGALDAITQNGDLLTELLAEYLPDVGYRPPTASYLAWLDFRALGWGDDPAERILSDARVALNSGPTFGTQGRGFARLNLACSPEVLTDAITRIAAAR